MDEGLFANLPSSTFGHEDILKHLEQGSRRQTRMAWQNIFFGRWQKKQQVHFVNPYTIFIDRRATIGEGTIIYPGVLITGPSVIGKNCIIGPNRWIHNCVFEDGVQYGARADMFASLIGSGSKIGAKAEVVRSHFGKNVNDQHHSYLGDTYVGDGANIGAGTITCNFDGSADKKRTVIRKNAFIGTNTNLVSPIEIPEDAFVAAGSTVSQKDIQNLAPHGLVVTRPEPRIIPNFFEKIGKYWRRMKKQPQE